MAIYDYDFGKYYGVREYADGERTIVDLEIVETSASTLESLIHSQTGFESILIATEEQCITYFLTLEEAQEFQDAIIHDKLN